MSLTSFAHGASGTVGVQGFDTGASTPSTFVQLAVKSWEATLEKKQEDASNTSVTGWTVAQSGKKTVKFTIEAQLALTSDATDYDNTVNPISASGPDLLADYCVVNLVGGLTANSSAGAVGSPAAPGPQSLFYCPQVVITEFKITNKEGDLISYTISGVSSGPVTINAGS